MPTNGNGKSSLLDTLFHEEIATLFELRMLGNNQFYNSYNTQRVFDNSDKFNFKNFKDDLNKIIANGWQCNDRQNNYAWRVYKEIKEAHFVLLDFFLNDENTYLAFDFIRNICDIKKIDENSSTTWFFITSAVYDSVVKYSQSGLLAEYYESAVVSAGDDPTNKKRQMIFIYKLLTFIKARLSSFDKYKKSIHEKLFGDESNDSKSREKDIAPQKCSEKYKNNGPPPCDWESCLEGLQTNIKRYLTEFDDVASIFYDSSTKEIKVIIESLDNLINQFIWLPEADWYIIQHQVDFINEKLKKIKDTNLNKCRFSCGYILKELKERSEVY